MTETLSTQDVPVQWAGELPKVHEGADTEFFLFPQEVGHLLVQEREDPDLEAEESAMAEPISAVLKTIPLPPRYVRVPRAKRLSTQPAGRYILLKKYEGVVTSRGEHSFVARLFENPSDYPVVEAEFDLEELSETDRELAVEGATLVWTIGYGYDGSTRKRESTIYLRRLPPWSEKEIEQGEQAATDLTRGIEWE